jgi:hypothetical protein
MQKAMFLVESYKKGILEEIDAGYILTVNVPDFTDSQRNLDPYRIEMISYRGVKAIVPLADGLMFRSAGRKIMCMIEPTTYANRHIEPAFRSRSTTEHMPYRASECDIYRTRDDKYRVLLPQEPVEYLDSFTVEFPRKGDICVLYFIFSDDIEGVVVPYIGESVERVLRSLTNLHSSEVKRMSSRFMDNVKRFHLSVAGTNPFV